MGIAPLFAGRSASSNHLGESTPGSHRPAVAAFSARTAKLSLALTGVLRATSPVLVPKNDPLSCIPTIFDVTIIQFGTYRCLSCKARGHGNLYCDNPHLLRNRKIMHSTLGFPDLADSKVYRQFCHPAPQFVCNYCILRKLSKVGRVLSR